MKHGKCCHHTKKVLPVLTIDPKYEYPKIPYHKKFNKFMTVLNFK